MSGFSNKTIAESMIDGLDVSYISKTCGVFPEFDGWEEDLDYNPWYKYNNDLLTEEEDHDIIEICKRYEHYRKELDKYYDRGTLT